MVTRSLPKPAFKNVKAGFIMPTFYLEQVSHICSAISPANVVGKHRRQTSPISCLLHATRPCAPQWLCSAKPSQSYK